MVIRCRAISVVVNAGAVLLAAVLLAVGQTAEAQTYTVIHSFTGGSDGGVPMAGVTLDHSGNLYGTANLGGNFGGNCGSAGCGLVYRLSNHSSSWVLTPLHSFTGGNDGSNPQIASVVFGPDGSIYSTTARGGGMCSNNPQGCGTIFKLQPAPNACRNVLCSWDETILYSFDGTDGANPIGALVFDAQGNVDGVTNAGSFRNGGIAFQLQSSGLMVMTLAHLYGYPGSGITIGPNSNLYGSTFIGMSSPGTIYQLMQSGSDWISTNIYEFTGGNDGGYPKAGVTFDPAGNLYGATSSGGSGQGGTVFQLTPSSNGWDFNLLYSFVGPGNGLLVVGPIGNLVLDAAGNLYGTTYSDGAFGCGAVFKLNHNGDGWSYTSLHDFTCGTDGAFPYSNLVFDTAGNIYGTASGGGAFGAGVVFEITP